MAYIKVGDIEPKHPSICPRCGAPLDGDVCEYCGTKFTKRNYNTENNFEFKMHDPIILKE